MDNNTQSIGKTWWLWVPCIFMALQVLVEVTLPGHIRAKIHDENGPHELLEFFAVFLGFIVAARTLFLPELKNRPWLRAWIIIAAVCCFYVGGEEISWGQQFGHWVTPGYWSEINDQHETNLHNTSSWLDQKPRALLIAGVLVGGLLVPLLRRYKPKLLPSRFNVIYPPAILSVTAALTAGVKITNALDTKLGLHDHFFTRASEVGELYMYYFVLLYLVVLRQRILQNQR